MSKTLGQIAYDAAGEKLGSYPGIGEWRHVNEDGKAYWEAAANAIVEECANELRRRRWAMSQEDCLKPGVLVAEEMIEFVRYLKCQATDLAKGEGSAAQAPSQTGDGGDVENVEV